MALKYAKGKNKFEKCQSLTNLLDFGILFQPQTAGMLSNYSTDNNQTINKKAKQMYQR